MFKERPPAMSFKIAADYFQNNLSDQEDSFTLNGDFYERTVSGNDLALSFDSQSDSKYNRLGLGLHLYLQVFLLFYTKNSQV